MITKPFLGILFWRAIAAFFVLLGLIGVALPIMPTVPFLIAALWAAGKGWPALEQRLINHPKYGLEILAWRNHRVIRRGPKWVAVTMMTIGYIVMWFTASFAPLWLKVTIGCVLFSVAIWIITRPERPPTKD